MDQQTPDLESCVLKLSNLTLFLAKRVSHYSEGVIALTQDLEKEKRETNQRLETLEKNVKELEDKLKRVTGTVELSKLYQPTPKTYGPLPPFGDQYPSLTSELKDAQTIKDQLSSPLPQIKLNDQPSIQDSL